jgi:amidase
MAQDQFRLEEATIADIHVALHARDLTCRELVEQYLARIEALDRGGPGLNSIVTTNPRALEEADVCDRALADPSATLGPLHGIPVVVKDQIETKDIATSFGSIAFKSYLPLEDATVVARLREAGAIVLAKTVLPDFAASWFAFSSVAGETRNPYALDRDPGGSSSGTAVAVAANLGAVGLGEDTGGSIRVPASFTSTVGVRVTTGLISRAGLFPLVSCQDTPGPITRTVEDAARLLDVLVAIDPKDPITAVAATMRPRQAYIEFARPGKTEGRRIGILRDAFGSGTDLGSRAVNSVMNRVLAVLDETVGDVVDPVPVSDLERHVEETSLYSLEARHNINRFLAARPHAPAHTLEELYESQRFHPMLESFADFIAAPDNPEMTPTYRERFASREFFQTALLEAMATHALDAMVYPSVRIPPPLKRDLYAGAWRGSAFPTNTLIASQAGLPAISVPAGFTDDGLPVGLELLGKPFDEPALISMAQGFEEATRARRAPPIAPVLTSEA